MEILIFYILVSFIHISFMQILWKFIALGMHETLTSLLYNTDDGLFAGGSLCRCRHACLYTGRVVMHVFTLDVSACMSLHWTCRHACLYTAGDVMHVTGRAAKHVFTMPMPSCMSLHLTCRHACIYTAGAIMHVFTLHVPSCMSSHFRGRHACLYTGGAVMHAPTLQVPSCMSLHWTCRRACLYTAGAVMHVSTLRGPWWRSSHCGGRGACLHTAGADMQVSTLTVPSACTLRINTLTPICCKQDAAVAVLTTPFFLPTLQRPVKRTKKCSPSVNEAPGLPSWRIKLEQSQHHNISYDNMSTVHSTITSLMIICQHISAP